MVSTDMNIMRLTNGFLAIGSLPLCPARIIYEIIIQCLQRSFTHTLCLLTRILRIFYGFSRMDPTIAHQHALMKTSQRAQYNNGRTGMETVYTDNPEPNLKDQSLLVASLTSLGNYEEGINPFNQQESRGQPLYINTTHLQDDHSESCFEKLFGWTFS